MTTVYEVLQELWNKAAGTGGAFSLETKRSAVDDAAVKINEIWRNRPAELPEIPRGKSLALSKMPYFMSLDKPGALRKEWFVVGVAEDLVPGEAIEVHRYAAGEGEDKQVVVLREHEYERVVHRGKENERRYVLASFDKEGW